MILYDPLCVLYLCVCVCVCVPNLCSISIVQKLICLRFFNVQSKMVCAILRPLPIKLGHLPLNIAGSWQKMTAYHVICNSLSCTLKNQVTRRHTLPRQVLPPGTACGAAVSACKRGRGFDSSVVHGGVIRSHQGLPAMMGIQPGNNRNTMEFPSVANVPQN